MKSCAKSFEKAKFLAPTRRRQKKTIKKGLKTVSGFLNLANILFTVVEAFIDEGCGLEFKSNTEREESPMVTETKKILHPHVWAFETEFLDDIEKYKCFKLS